METEKKMDSEVKKTVQNYKVEMENNLGEKFITDSELQELHEKLRGVNLENFRKNHEHSNSDFFPKHFYFSVPKWKNNLR